ncbi:MAG: hypothetical protein M3008_13080 [Chloroflexota bacterium]|nr:hypothetical protein [Chloroflexota bacterium]
MSTSNGTPPVGAGYGLPTNDPDESVEERRTNTQQDHQDRIGEQEREVPNIPMSAEQKVEQIVVREQGVSSFADAEEVDRMERLPSVNDREQGANDSGDIVSDTVKGAWNALDNPDDRDKSRR